MICPESESNSALFACIQGQLLFSKSMHSMLKEQGIWRPNGHNKNVYEPKAQLFGGTSLINAVDDWP